MAGLDVVGKPLGEQWVFRSNIFSNFTNLPLMHKVTESSIADIMLHDMKSIIAKKTGLLKIAFLNKAETNETLESGDKIAAILEERGQDIFHRVILGCLKETPVIHQCRIFN